MGIAIDGPGSDGEPGVAVGGEHVSVMKVAVHYAAGAGRIGDDVAAQRDHLFHQPVRKRRAARKRFEVGGPLLEIRSERA